MSECTLTAKDAITKVMDEGKLSKYAVAKRMGVTANMIDYYLNGSQMRAPTAARFEFAFSITISDVL